MEPGQSVHHSGRSVSPDSNWPAVRRDGEDVSRSPQGGNSNPTRIRTKRDILKEIGGILVNESVP